MTAHSSHLGTVVGLVQARMGSRRLPGKMMLDLCGRPVLSWVLTRVCRSRWIDKVVLATTALACDDCLAALADQMGVACFRGSENDVLSRFAAAAEQHEAATVVRICADNPLIAPEELDRLVAFYEAAIRDGADPMRLYAYNHVPSEGNEYPDGLGGEIVSAPLLYYITRCAAEFSHREHAFDYIESHRELYDIRAVPPQVALRGTGIRLDVDTAEDLAFLSKICKGLTVESDPAAIVRAARALKRVAAS